MERNRGRSLKRGRWDKINSVKELRHLTGLSRAELIEFFGEMGEPRFRADQVFRGLHERPRDYWLLDARGLTAEVYRVQGPGGPSWVLARVAD